MRFDHGVILVRELERAADHYQQLGFTVTPGGEHAGGATHNALIAFADGSYLELLAYTRPWLRRSLPWLRRFGMLGTVAERHEGLQRRFLWRSAHGEGLIDFALLPADARAELARLRGVGIAADGPLPGARVRPDGAEARWELGLPRAPDLPFLCADVTPRALRVPEGSSREHPNGALGVAEVVVAVANLETSSARYRALLGADPRSSLVPSLPHVRGRAFALQGSRLLLAAPDGPSPELRGHLRSHGEGAYALRLRTAADGPPRSLDPGRAHGARLELVPGVVPAGPAD